jgi:hypothetical protein
MSTQNWYSLGKMFGVIAIAAALFAAGRYTATTETKIVTVDRIVEKQLETKVINQQVDIAQLLKKIEDYTKIQKKTRVVVVKPDGTRIEKETDNTSVAKKTDTTQDTKIKETKQEVVIKEVIKIEEHTKIIDNTRNEKYRFALGVGYGLPALWQEVPNYVPGLPKGLMLDGSAGIKVIGPFFLEGFLTSRLDTGLRLSVGF